MTVTVSGMVQTTTTKFGNPAAKPVIKTETGVLIADSVSLSGDLSMKTARYRFKDGSETVVNTNRTKTTVTWGKDNITKTTRYDYADKSTHSLSETVEPTITVTWANNNITKTTVKVFGNGERHFSVENVQPIESTVQYSDAIYPSTWASGNGGVVTPPDVSDRLKVYGNGHIEVLENGSSSLPFLQSTLSVRNISDPNSFVKTNTSLYDLTWGKPSSVGPTIATTFRNAGAGLKTRPFNIAGYRIGVCYSGVCEGPTIKRPTDDVLDAWDKGWTGKGSKILIIDDFGSNNGFKSTKGFHGIYTSALAGYIAIESEILTFDWSFRGQVQEAFGSSFTQGSLAAINMSFDYVDDSSNVRNIAKDLVTSVFATPNYLINNPAIWMSDAVLIKAAGNDNKTLTNRGGGTALTVALIENNVTDSKTIIVGALDKDGSVQNKAAKASYSNTPGSDTKFQNRFVMANGTSPFLNEFYYDNYYDKGNGQGTSYAAPRLAGYIGILRHKFPNLNAEKSASIILDTARTDTLWCHPNCQSSVVGRGEASLSRALAPVGKLR